MKRGKRSWVNFKFVIKQRPQVYTFTINIDLCLGVRCSFRKIRNLLYNMAQLSLRCAGGSLIVRLLMAMRAFASTDDDLEMGSMGMEEIEGRFGQNSEANAATTKASDLVADPGP